jgi:hypothetical protein
LQIAVGCRTVLQIDLEKERHRDRQRRRIESSMKRHNVIITLNLRPCDGLIIIATDRHGERIECCASDCQIDRHNFSACESCNGTVFGIYSKSHGTCKKSAPRRTRQCIRQHNGGTACLLGQLESRDRLNQSSCLESPYGSKDVICC